MDSETERLSLPLDIQEAVSAAFNATLPEGYALWQILPDGFYDEVHLAIGRAIVAERTRCAALVESFRETTTEGRGELAADIMSGRLPNRPGT